MNARFEQLPERAKVLALQVGDSLRDRVPDRALQWMETGAAIGAMKQGTRVAGRFARRNPTLLVAAAAGAGLLWLAARRRHARQQAGDTQASGRTRQVDAQRETRSAARTRRSRADGNHASSTVTDA